MSTLPHESRCPALPCLSRCPAMPVAPPCPAHRAALLAVRLPALRVAPPCPALARGAACGTPRTPFFEGCSPSPLAPSYASAATVDILGAKEAEAASAPSGKRLSSKGKGGKSRGSGSRGGGGAVEAVEVAEVAVGVVAGVGASVAAVVVAVGVVVVVEVGVVAATVVAVGVELFRGERGASGGSVRCPYVIRTGDRTGQTCGKFHTEHRCSSRLDDAWRADFGDEAERPCWLELPRFGVDIFALDYDAILATTYALTVSAEGDCYLCVPPDPGIEAAALGASESALPFTAPAEDLHTLMLDSGASRCFCRDSTTLIPFPAPVPVRLAGPSGGPVLARSTIVLPCPARKEKQSTKLTSAMDADSSAGGKGRDDKEVSCLLVGVVESTVSLAPEVGEDFHAMAAAVQANPEVVLLDSGCSHHLMGTKAAFVDLGPSGDVKHVRGFNGALQDVSGRGTVALQGEDEKQVLIADVLYVPGVRANLLSTGQLKENGVKLQEDGGMMLLVSAAGDVLGRASYTGRVLCTDLRPRRRSWPCGSVKHEVATGLDLKSALGTDSPCVLCVGRKLARHTFLDQGSDAADMLAVVHIDLCGPFCVAAKDGSLYFLLLKDRKTRYVWVRPVAKKSDMLLEFQKGVPREAAHQLRGWQGDHPRPDLPLHPAVERHGGAGDAHGGGVGEDDATAHGRAAPLVAPRSGAGYLGSQLPGAGGAAAEDNAVLAVHQDEAQPVNGTCVGLHGAVPRPRAAAWWEAEAEGQHVGRGVLREHVVGGVEVGARAGVGADADHPDGDAPSARRASQHESDVDAGKGGADRGSAADDGEVGKGGSGTAAVDRGAGSGEADHGAVGDWAVSRGADLRGAAGGDADHDAARCWG
ncbi:unnamed protein product [Closterium sp. NIES-54]